ncbi:monocarboxylate transporter 4-like [Mizuhopecten yessoensis]|uniref:Monocarboxylate transporter 4 n=1 Tax=Mizuhopecten yessoensis TaxID=6573 RepID=A0A210QQG2_MIZYE|nr:monocarboxylate transporter 4-like [Mizuhopecten yessoensis]OWF50976.1 Monocarboxylate transporter 4 [Mizuhopecten yessoensis]
MILSQPDKGWSWVALFAAFFVMFVEGAFMGALGIIHLALLDRYAESNMKTAMAGSLFVCMNTTGGILCSALVERYSCRVVTVTGSLLFTVGLLICALPVSLDVVMFAYGILAGIGSSLTNTAAFIVVGYNFKQRINIANGISASGMCFGSLVMPPVVEMLRAYYGNTMIFVILGCMSLQQAVLGALYFPAYLEHSRKKRTHNEKTKQSSLVKSVCLHWLRMLKNASFICIIGYLCLLQLGAFVNYLHFPKFVTTLGFTSMQASYLLTVKGVFAFFARLLLAAFVNSNSYNIDLTTLMFGTCTFMALASILLPFYGTSFPGLVIFCIFGGLYGDSVIGILNALNIDIVGYDNFASATGIEFAVMGIGIFVGPTLVGLVIDLGGTYTFCFSVTGAILLLAGFLSLIAGTLKSPHRKELVQGDQVLDVFLEQNNSSEEDRNLYKTNL